MPGQGTETMAARKEQLHGGRAADRPVPLLLRVMRLSFSLGGALFPRLLGRWAFALWFRTRRFPESAAGKRIARDAQHELISHDNLPVAVYRWGNAGPKVLFVHGWSGRGSQVAAFVAPLLEAGCQVLALDLPGHGESRGESTNILECAAVLQTIDDRFGPFQAAITHSFGGMVLAYAIRHGLQVQRAAMISAPSDVEFLINSFAETLSFHPRVTENLWRRLDTRFDAGFNERISTVNNVSKLEIPGLVVHDVQDSSVPLAEGERIAQAWPGARFMQTTGLGHGRILRDKQVVSAVTSFIADQQGVEG